jgi:hypothetical protein
LLFWVAGLALIGSTLSCGSPQTQRLTPYIDYSKFNPTGKSLLVKRVGIKGAEELKITAEDFQSALLDCLNKSGLFTQVSTSGAGDYVLKAEILSQKFIPGMTANAIFFVHYRLADAKTKKILWRQSLVSQFNAYGADPPRVAEGAVRDNLSQMIENVAKAVAKD